ncbi:MAG: hypothetical protein ABFR97_02315 [Thermodesulfobacteriota bacterium]
MSTAKKEFDLFIRNLLTKSCHVSIMGLIRDSGTVVRLYDQYGLTREELEQRLTTTLEMSRLFGPADQNEAGPDQKLQANDVAISISALTHGWHLIVMGKEGNVPGQFPALCADYRQKLSEQKEEQQAQTTPEPNSTPQQVGKEEESLIIGDPDDYFINPLLKASQAEEKGLPAAMGAGRQDKASTVIGDPDHFFANPLSNTPAQLVMAAIKE